MSMSITVTRYTSGVRSTISRFMLESRRTLFTVVPNVSFRTGTLFHPIGWSGTFLSSNLSSFQLEVHEITFSRLVIGTPDLDSSQVLEKRHKFKV